MTLEENKISRRYMHYQFYLVKDDKTQQECHYQYTTSGDDPLFNSLLNGG